jgi:exosortase A
MQPDVTAGAQPRIPGVWHIPRQWQAPLLQLAATLLVLGLVFREDWAAMAQQWWNSSTYNHILAVPAIVAWLIKQRAPALARLVPGPWWPGLVVFAGAMIVWFLGSLAGVALVRDLGTVSLTIAAALALLGPRVGAVLAFPLGYLLFLAPFGEELVPQLQMVTAALTIWLVRISAIPASIDGVFIATPAGLFEVAEACSGISFLVAMIAFGVLVAHVGFAGWRRRCAFLLLCVAMPVLANGVRAWGTIYLAQYVGAERASGFDHILYGWLFLALVVAATLALAWRFFDRPAGAAPDAGVGSRASPLLDRLAGMRIGAGAALLLLAALAIGAKSWVAAADGLAAPLPKQIFLPTVPGWRQVDYAPQEWWQPRASGASHRLLGRYADGSGRKVDVFFALYASQGPGREAGGFGEGALRPESGWSWQSPGASPRNAASDRLLGSRGTARLAQTSYRTGPLLTGSNAHLRIAALQDRLLLKSRPTMVLILSAEEQPGQPAAPAIAAFRQATGPLGPWMDRVAAVR